MRNKKTAAVLVLLALLLSATGCGEKPATSSSGAIIAASSSLSGSSSAAAVSEDSPKLVPVDPILQVYSFRPDSKLYKKVEAGNVPDTLLEVVQTVAQTQGLPDPQVTAITQQKGMVTIDFDKSFMDSYTKEDTERYLNSVGMTLMNNHRSFETVIFTVGGERGAFGDGPWDIEPLKLNEGDPAAFKAMREKTAYSRSQVRYNSEGGMEKLNTDATAKSIADLLSAANIAGISFASPAELPSDNVVLASIDMTQGFARSNSAGYDGYPISDAMEPIFAAVSLQLDMQEDMVWVQEHVEESAKQLYGQDYVLEHRTVGKYEYFPTEGVYTPPHMGGGGWTLSNVIDYTDSGGTITATVSYAFESMGGISVVGDWEKLIAPEKLADYLNNEAVRYTVTLGKNADGTFYIMSQQPVS